MTISNERLEELVGMQVSPFCETKSATLNEWQEIAKELLALRKAAIPEEFLNAKQNASGMFEISEDCMCQLLNLLCNKPTLP